MARRIVRFYFDALPASSGQTEEEINKEIEYWKKKSDELTDWIEPDEDSE